MQIAALRTHRNNIASSTYYDSSPQYYENYE